MIRAAFMLHKALMKSDSINKGQRGNIMGFLDNLGGGMSGMLQTPEGQEMVKKFLSSPDGENMIIGYISTPEGKKPLVLCFSA